jgi:hypothetical protein
VPFALHRRTEELGAYAVVGLFHAGADARRRPASSSTTPPTPLLSATLLGDWIFLLHARRRFIAAAQTPVSSSLSVLVLHPFCFFVTMS